MKNYFFKVRTLALSHKIISSILLLVILFAGYQAVKAFTSKTTATTYTLGVVQKGTIASVVTGTGQVSASNQLDIKSKVSGDVTSVRVKNGDEVKEGTVIAQIDATDAVSSVTDAQNSLRSAQISLEKVLKPAEKTTQLQTQNAVTDAEQSKATAQDNIKKSYDDAFNTVASAFLDLQPAVTNLEDILNRSYLGDNTVGNQYGSTAKQYKTDAEHEYYAAKKKFDTAFIAYKSVSRTSDQASIDAVISSTYDAAREMANAVKELNTLVDYVEHQSSGGSTPANLSTDQTTLDSATSKFNSDIASLLSAQTSIKTAKDNFAAADRTIEEKTASLKSLDDGADPLDVETAQLTVAQRQATLTTAREKLADYTIRAPFDGIIADVTIKKGDSLSSNGAVATIVTQKKIATVTLNEVDVTKVKTGQKATLSFDAVEGLTITGEVYAVDLVGTVSQGVVSYDVDISFDTDDDRIKPGMSASASIITDVHQDVLTVPASAVKTQGDTQYVEYFPSSLSSQTPQITTTSAPLRKTVTTGISDDTSVEIVSGLTEGESIVTRSAVTTAKTAATQSAPSLFGGGGGGARTGGGGGASIRAITR